MGSSCPNFGSPTPLLRAWRGSLGGKQGEKREPPIPAKRRPANLLLASGARVEGCLEDGRWLRLEGDFEGEFSRGGGLGHSFIHFLAPSQRGSGSTPPPHLHAFLLETEAELGGPIGKRGAPSENSSLFYIPAQEKTPPPHVRGDTPACYSLQGRDAPEMESAKSRGASRVFPGWTAPSAFAGRAGGIRSTAGGKATPVRREGRQKPAPPGDARPAQHHGGVESSRRQKRRVLSPGGWKKELGGRRHSEGTLPPRRSDSPPGG